MKRISLIAVDLDGTLLTSRKKISSQSIKYLLKANRSGVHVVLSTTRNPRSAVAFAREIGIGDPLICTNGAQLLASPDGPILLRRTIPHEAAASIAAFADENGWILHTTVGDTDYICLDPDKPQSSYPDRIIVNRNSNGIVGPPLRILTTHPVAIAGLAEYCSKYLAQQVRVDKFVDSSGVHRSTGIFGPGVDKGTGLGELVARLGIDREEVLAIGDDECDLAMLPYSGVFVAMENASGVIKAKAHDVCPSNDSEGVAWTVAKYIFDEDLESAI